MLTSGFRAWKIECEVLTPAQCQEKCPLLNVDDLFGGLWIPGDGVGDPYETCISLVGEAKKLGKSCVKVVIALNEVLWYCRGESN